MNGAAVKHIRNGLWRFFFAPASAYPLAVLRIGVASVMLVQALFVAPWILDLYGPNGLLQGGLNSYILTPLLPAYLDWPHLAQILNVQADFLIKCFFAIYVFGLASLIVGFKTRFTAVIVWLGHFLLAMNEGYKSSYGVDTFANIFFFYFMIFPMGHALAFDHARAADTLPPTSSDDDAVSMTSWNRFAIRIMQIHLAIAYCTSGIAKAAGPQWRNGEAIWRAVMMPQFTVFDMSWLAHYSWLSLLLSWSTLALEIGYPVLLGVRRLRFWGALAVIGMHVGIAVFMGLWSFAMLMMTLTGSLYLVCATSRQLTVVSPAR